MMNGTLTDELDGDARTATAAGGAPVAIEVGGDACSGRCDLPAATDRLVRAVGLLAVLVGLAAVAATPALTLVPVLRGLPWQATLSPMGTAAPGAYFGLRLFSTGVALIQRPRHPPGTPLAGARRRERFGGPR